MFTAMPGLQDITNLELVPFAVNMYEYDGCEEGSFGERYECYVAACSGSLDPACLPGSQELLDPWAGQMTGRALTCVRHTHDPLTALEFAACFGDIRGENPTNPPPINEIIWQCAERAGLDVDTIRGCTEGATSLAYARSDMERMLHPRYHHRFSPQVYLNYQICSVGEGGPNSICDCGGSTCPTQEIPRIICEQYAETCNAPACELPTFCLERAKLVVCGEEHCLAEAIGCLNDELCKNVFRAAVDKMPLNSPGALAFIAARAPLSSATEGLYACMRKNGCGVEGTEEGVDRVCHVSTPPPHV